MIVRRDAARGRYVPLLEGSPGWQRGGLRLHLSLSGARSNDGQQYVQSQRHHYPCLYQGRCARESRCVCGWAKEADMGVWSVAQFYNAIYISYCKLPFYFLCPQTICIQFSLSSL